MNKPPLPRQDFNEVIEVFALDVRKYLPLEKDYVPTIRKVQQDKVLDRFKKNASKGKFSLTINAETLKLENALGIFKNLGYKDETFTTKQFFNITHEVHAIPHWINGSSIFDLIDENKNLVTFDDIQFVYHIAMMHADGTYKYCMCESFVFQISECRKALAFGYEFTVSNNFKNEEFIASINDNNGVRTDLIPELDKHKKKKFATSGIFMEKHLEILNFYAYKDFDSKDVAKKMNKSMKQVHDYNRYIY